MNLSPQPAATGRAPSAAAAWHSEVELPPTAAGAFGHGGAPAPLRIWRIDLHASSVPRDPALLSATERARHDRLVFADDRARFAAAHAAVRHLIGQAAGVAPAGLDFEEGPHGKPRLAGPQQLSGTAFNLSHGHDIGLLLWAPFGGDWGVDVERLRTVADADAIGRRVFTPDEFAAWKAGPPADRDRRFLVLWTRKEACLKAIGSGFAVEPHRFHVGLDPSPCDVVLPTPDGPEARVRMVDLDVGAEAIAALARVLPP